MIGEKVEHFQGKDKDLGALQSHIEEYLKNDGFSVQSSSASPQGVVIQAKKDGFLRTVVDADRALTITISGTRPTSRSASGSVVGLSTSPWPRSRRCSSRTCSSSST